jgi:hypothetical protein
MGMITIPMPWSTKMNTNITSIQLKMKVGMAKTNDFE